MSDIRCYFTKKSSHCDGISKKSLCLPDPAGPLSKEVPSSSIRKANEEVKATLEKQKETKKRGPYQTQSLPADEKLKIAKYASLHGTTAAIRTFKKEMPELTLKESTVRTWRDIYRLEIKKRSASQEDNADSTALDTLPTKKKGRPFLLGNTLDQQVQAYIWRVREAGGIITSSIVITAARGLVTKHDSSLLDINGGPISLKKNWANSLLSRMGLVKRKANTSVSKMTVEDFEKVKNQMLIDIKCTVVLEDIPPALIINWDQTAINYVPTSNWTMAEVGAKQVEAVGVSDKRQITAVFGCTILGDFLPMQLIYKGKTSACHPTIPFPADWCITHTANHWSNEDTMLQYIEKIVIPYTSKKKEELRLPPDHPSLAIFDVFRGQCTESVCSLLQQNNIHFVTVPANTTDKLQPLDVSVNKPAKDFLREKFNTWYAEKVVENDDSSIVDMKLQIMKPLCATWMIQLFDYMKANPDIIRNGFKHVGITDIILDSEV